MLWGSDPHPSVNYGIYLRRAFQIYTGTWRMSFPPWLSDGNGQRKGAGDRQVTGR